LETKTRCLLWKKKRKFRALFLGLLALVLAAAPPLEVNAQTDRAAVTNALTKSVEEARKAGVPDTTVITLLSLGYENGVEPASMAELVRITGEIRKKGLPLEPFVDKIAEGVAKRVPAASIENLLNQKQQDYQFAQSITVAYLKKHGIRQQPTSGDLSAIAESLYSGMTRQDLTLTMERAPAVPLFSLKRVIDVQASLKQAGFDPKLSDRIISTALERNFFERQRRGFVRAILAAKRKGISDLEITEAALTTMRNGGTVGSFCSLIGVSSSEIGN